MMRDKLGWTVVGERFEDGSLLSNWKHIDGGVWQWQYDTHELRFDIYEHAGAFWKLYRMRSAPPGSESHDESWGGVACRVALVSYRRLTGSPHSRLLKGVGEQEWVRVGEIDPEVHDLLREFVQAA